MHYQRSGQQVAVCEIPLKGGEKGCRNLDRVNCDVCLGIVAMEHEERGAALRTRIAENADKRMAAAERERDAENAEKQAEIQRAKDIAASKVALQNLVRKTFLN